MIALIDDFLLARLGSVGGSNIGEALSVLTRASGGRGPGDPTKASLDLQFRLAAERITGQVKYVNPLEWGNAHEDEARAVYALTTNALVIHRNPDGSRIVIRHPTIQNAHTSPDGLVDEDGGVELKCPTSEVHLKTLFFGVVPEEHIAQIHWNMGCTGRQWWDFQSYDPRFPVDMQCFVKRTLRDDARIAEMEAGAKKFLAGVDEKINRMIETYSRGIEVL